MPPHSPVRSTEATAASDPLDWLTPERGQSHSAYALELDHLLWRGFDDRALPWLYALRERGPEVERAAAGWVLARWEMTQGKREQALRSIMAFHSCKQRRQIVDHAGPSLLAIQLAVSCGETTYAEDVLTQASERFGASPDFDLARLQLARAGGAHHSELSAILGQIYSNLGLTGVRLSESEGNLFDRLLGDNAVRDDASSQDQPLVSVIVPVFNGANVLRTALRGLSKQSWQNLEILVVNDGSSDDSLAVARAAAAKDSRIRPIDLGGNQGAYPARNVGFSEARGDFVTVHDADDWAHPQKIEYQARALIEGPDLKATVSHWVRAGNDLEMTLWRMEESWVFRNVSSLMLRASLREELGYWDRVKVNADTEYYYRILHAYGPGSVEEVLPGVPLAFGRTLLESLTNRSATHMRTQYRGVRRDYMEAAHSWHSSATEPSDLYLSREPEQRSFYASPQIALDERDRPSSDHSALAQSSFLDDEWYLLANPDIVQSNFGAARHYHVAGAQENRDPGPLFSSGGYRLAQGLDAKANPLLHFLNEGQEQGASALPTFTGALAASPTDNRCVLVFAHTSGETLFGAERSLIDVVKRLGRDGYAPVVVLPTVRNPDYLQSLLEISVAVEILPQSWRHGVNTPAPSTVDAARDLIRRYRPREVHVNTLVLEAALIAARAECAPSVVYVREMPAEDKALCRALGMSASTLRSQLLDQADRFVIPSQVVANWLDCPERCTVRPNAVDEALFDLPFAPGRVLKVALISSNVAKKGINDAVEAAQIVAEKGWPVHFSLIGPETEELAALHPLPPNVAVPGYVATPEEAIAQADIVLSLSHFAESFGRTVVEAMAAGRPVICYDRGAPPSLIISGKTGFVVPADSPKGVADAVLALNLARLQLDKMSHAARQRAREIQEQALA